MILRKNSKKKKQFSCRQINNNKFTMEKLAYFMLIASAIVVVSKADFFLPNFYGEDANQGQSFGDMFRNVFQEHSYQSHERNGGQQDRYGASGYETRYNNDFASEFGLDAALTRRDGRRKGTGLWKRTTTKRNSLPTTTLSPGDDPDYWKKPLTKQQERRCEKMAEYPNKQWFKFCDKLHMEIWDLKREAQDLKDKMDVMLDQHELRKIDLKRKKGDKKEEIMEFVTLLPKNMDY